VYFLAHLIDHYGNPPDYDPRVDLHGNSLNVDDLQSAAFAYNKHAMVQFFPGPGNSGTYKF
jgi:hypothetical protein